MRSRILVPLSRIVTGLKVIVDQAIQCLHVLLMVFLEAD